MMVDPDVPSRANRTSEARHWLVMNIPGCDVQKGDTVDEFFSSAPQLGTGYHRYTLLVFKQPCGKIAYDEPYTSNT